ncbi:hypothetical protein GTO27_01395 [Candidatus Bathyarchaeota archaeon]|nr:hypothetical protein [Candidatus Bathyarchaeota archaeon]
MKIRKTEPYERLVSTTKEYTITQIADDGKPDKAVTPRRRAAEKISQKSYGNLLPKHQIPALLSEKIQKII